MPTARAVAFRLSLHPMLKRANNLALAALLGATVLATTHSPPARSQAVEFIRVDVQTVAKGYRASKLRGATVQNDKDEKIGSIDDLIVGKDQVLFAVLQVGGFLGIGGHLVAVPYKNLMLDDTGAKITLPGASKDELKKLPEFRYLV
jgi:hypothetical protein